MPELILYGHPDSGHACKIATALSLASLDHETVFVDIWAEPSTRPKAFLDANPAAEVPVLMIDGVAHVQSGSILLELARKFGCLGGETPRGMRRAQELIMWEANRIGMCLPQLKEAQRTGDMAVDVRAWLEGRYAADAARFDLYLDDAPFFHGADPGAGDCAIWGYVQWVEAAGVAPSAAMRGWLDRMHALPEVRSSGEYFPGS